jgi:hypothetical protein
MNVRHPIKFIIITNAESFAQLIAASQYRQRSEIDLRCILQIAREGFGPYKIRVQSLDTVQVTGVH